MTFWISCWYENRAVGDEALRKIIRQFDRLIRFGSEERKRCENYEKATEH